MDQPEVDVAIGQDGRKYTLTDGQQWTRKHTDHKVVLNWGTNGELTTHQQAIKTVSQSEILILIKSRERP